MALYIQLLVVDSLTFANEIYIQILSLRVLLPPISGDLAVSDQTKEHLQELCQKCIELGHYCRKAKIK